jgi:hypothetical protein
LRREKSRGNYYVTCYASRREGKRNSLIDQRKKKINKHSLHVGLMNIVIDREIVAFDMGEIMNKKNHKKLKKKL